MQPGDVPATFADVERLARATGFAPHTTIEDGIAGSSPGIGRITVRRDDRATAGSARPSFDVPKDMARFQ